MDRSKSIGSSEIGAIIGVNPYCTALDIYNDKIYGSGFSGNKYTEAGTRLEKVVAEYFTDRAKRELVHPPEVTYRHPGADFITASPDRLYDGGTGILECKTSQRTIDRDFIPEYWFCQAQYQAAVMNACGWGITEISLAWLVSGVDFDYHSFEVDPDFGEYLIRAATDFWEGHIIPRIPPEVSSSKQIGPSKYGKQVQAVDETVAEWQRLIEVRDKIKSLKEIEDQIIESLKMIMGDAEALMFYETPLVTWKTTKPITRFDAKALEKDQPEIWERYRKEYPGNRVFLVKA